MTDATLSLQQAIVATLNAAPLGLSGRVHDRIPSVAAFPYVQIAEGQTLDDGAECIDAVEVYLDLHVWSRAIGAVECRSLVGRIRTALHSAPLALQGPWRLVDLRHDSTRFMNDPDGITSHAVVTFRALMDPI